MGATWRVLVAVGAAAVLLAGAAGSAASEADPRTTVVGRDYRISGANATAADISAAVAWNPEGNEYLVVWQDDRNATSGRGSDVYGRLVGADGIPVGLDRRISGPSATADEAHPAAAWNAAAGEYLVVWQDDRNIALSRGSDIYGRRVGANGAPVGGDFRISGPAAVSTDQAPALAGNDTSSEFLVVWQDLRSAPDRSWDIYGRRVSSDGARIGSDFRISGPLATSPEFDPAVAWNSSANEYLVAWNDYRSTGAGRGSDIYGRRLGADGARLGNDFRVCGGNGIAWEYEPAAAWNGAADQYLVVWNDYRNVGLGRGSDIYGKRVAANGSVVGVDFRISGPYATADEEDPAVGWTETGSRYLVVWVDDRNVGLGRGSDIYGRQLQADLIPASSDFRVSGAGALSYEQDPALAGNRDLGQYLVVWNDFRNSARGSDIWGRRVGG